MLPADQCRAEVDRVLESEAFRGRDSLRRLFAFLAEKTLDGTSDSLKEYTIGVEIFGRPADYDPQKDASCRIQAGKLRQKLEEYYRTEGSENPIHIELPKRQFTLLFHSQETPSLPAQQEARFSTRFGRTAAAVLFALSLVMAWGIGRANFLNARASSSSRNAPLSDELWTPFLTDKRPTAICLGVPLFVRHSVLRVRDSHLNQWDTPDSQKRLASIGQLLKTNELTPSYEYTGVGEAVGAMVIAKALAQRGIDAAIRRSNALTWDDLKNSNLVFLGSPKFNPLLRNLPVHQAFVVEDSQVKNLSPKPQEPTTYGRVVDSNGMVEEDHAVISRLPGLDGRGTILLLDGISTSSAWAGAEYVTRPESLQTMAKQLGMTESQLPPYFQVVIRVKYRDMVPVEMACVNYRVF